MVLDPKVAAGYRAISKILLGMAAETSKRADEFSNWFALGIGTILALMVSNIDKLIPYTGFNAIRRMVVWYFISLFLVLIQKRMGTMVLAASKGSSIAEEHMQEIIDSGIPFNGFTNQVLKGSMWINKIFISRIFKKMEKAFEDDDITWTARRFSRIAQYQTIIVTMQVLLSIYVVWILVSAILSYP